MAGGDEDKTKYYRDDASERLVSIYHGLYDLLPLVLVLLMVYLPLTLIWDVYHWGVDLLELTIIGYFATKILTGFLIYESKRTYLKKNWLDILLILPFLAAFRAVGVAAQVLRGAYIVEALGLSGMLGETALAARFAHVGRTGRYATYLSEIKYLQKVLHFVKDIPLVVQQYGIGAFKAKVAALIAVFRRKPPEN